MPRDPRFTMLDEDVGEVAAELENFVYTEPREFEHARNPHAIPPGRNRRYGRASQTNDNPTQLEELSTYLNSIGCSPEVKMAALLVEAIQSPREYQVRRGPRRDDPMQNSGTGELGPQIAPNPGAIAVIQTEASVIKNAAGNPHGPTGILIQVYYDAKSGLLTSNFKLVVDVKTTFGRGTQEFSIDAPEGQILSVSAAESVNVSARLVSPDGNALVADVPVRVEASVLRGGTFTSKPVYLSDTIYSPVAAGGTAKLPIPSRAVHAFALLSDQSKAADVDLLFYGSTDAGATLLYQMTLPTNGKVPIVAGARAYAIVNRSGGYNITPVFEIAT